MSAKLIITKHGQTISEIELDQTLITVGRKHINDLHLDDPGVSGNHAKVLTVGEESFIEDLGSTNGTFLNSHRIDKSPLKDQDCIVIGEFELRYINAMADMDDSMDKTVIIQASPSPRSAPKTTSADSPISNDPKATDSLDQAHASLKVIDGPSLGKSISLSGIITRIKGPNGQSSLISKKDDGYYLLNTLLIDVAPAINGVAVPVGSTKLNNGDIISMGSSQLRFKV